MNNSQPTLAKLNEFQAQLATQQTEIKKKCDSYEEKLASSSKSDPKKLHGYIRNKKASRPSVGPLKIGNELTDDPTRMAEALVTTFSNVYDNTPPPPTL